MRWYEILKAFAQRIMNKIKIEIYSTNYIWRSDVGPRPFRTHSIAWTMDTGQWKEVNVKLPKRYFSFYWHCTSQVLKYVWLETEKWRNWVSLSGDGPLLWVVCWEMLVETHPDCEVCSPIITEKHLKRNLSRTIDRAIALWNIILLIFM